MEKGEECTLQMVEDYLRVTVNSYEPMFEAIVGLLSARQKELIVAIAKEGKAKGGHVGIFREKTWLDVSKYRAVGLAPTVG